jgi:hypothetical protein
LDADKISSTAKTREKGLFWTCISFSKRPKRHSRLFESDRKCSSSNSTNYPPSIGWGKVIHLQTEYLKAHYSICKIYSEIGDQENLLKESEAVKKLGFRAEEISSTLKIDRPFRPE